LREVGKTRFEANYQNHAQEIFDRIDAKYQQLNKDYDEDTEHMTNRIQQNSWDVYFGRKLEYMPPS
jgi:ribosome assembly protein YihI (activator of Der GTPase)